GRISGVAKMWPCGGHTSSRTVNRIQPAEPLLNAVPTGRCSGPPNLFLVRNSTQVIENRKGCTGSNKLLPVEADPVWKKHLLQALFLSERRVAHRFDALGRTRSANARMASTSISSSSEE